MSTFIFAEQSQNFNGRQWLTTADVARMLERSPWSVRWLARTGRLACETTQSGQRLFRLGDVLRLVDQRAKARLRSVYVGRSKFLSISGEPRQMSLFRARLRLVDGGHRRGQMIPGGVDTTGANTEQNSNV